MSIRTSTSPYLVPSPNPAPPAPELSSLIEGRGRWAGVAVALLFAALLLPASVREAAASPFEPAALYGADVRSLAIDPADPDRIIAGTAGGQIYLSRDGGDSWTAPPGGQPFLGWVVSALHFDPNRPERLWLALWGVWGGGLVAYADAPFNDGERVEWQWREEKLPPGQIYSMTLVPGREGWMYVGTREGVFGSRDGGRSWRDLTSAIPHIKKITSLLVAPGNPDTVYAGSWQRAYRSDDAGETWRGVFEGMLPDSEVFTLTPVPGNPKEMWASTCGWVYRSTDAGESWTRRKEGMSNRRVPSFAVLPDGRVMAGTVGGGFISSDHGASWRRVTEPGLAIHAIAVTPERPDRVILGTEGSGVWISKNAAATFYPAAREMTHVRVADLAKVERGDGRMPEVLAAVNHAGPASGMYSSIDGGRTFQHQRRGLPTVLQLAVTSERVYAATEKGLYERHLGLEWRQVAEIGDRRVEGVVAGLGRVVAWTADGLFERGAEGRFTPIEAPAAPEGVALEGGSLWMSGDGGLWRRSGESFEVSEVPAADGRPLGFAGRLLLAGDGGVWERSGDSWSRLAGEGGRALVTGDRRYPLLLVEEGEASLLRGDSGEVMSLDLAVPVRDLTTALTVGERLLVATSGHGVLAAPLAELTADAAGVGAAPSSEESARRR